MVAVAAGTAPPNDVTYQGLLLDSSGYPLPGPVEIEIGVWDDHTRLYWERHAPVDLENGVFNIPLGLGTPLDGSFDAVLFADGNRWLEVTVEGEVMTPRQLFRSVAYAFQCSESETATYAANAGDADTLDGQHASELDQSAHASDANNPHGVTAVQVGAATYDELIAHTSNTSNPHSVTAV
jgi:hypothetical protein